MRNLSVVAFLLGISVACSNQPAATVPPPTGTGSQPAAGVPREPADFQPAAPVLADTLVAFGNSGNVMIDQARR